MKKVATKRKQGTRQRVGTLKRKGVKYVKQDPLTERQYRAVVNSELSNNGYYESKHWGNTIALDYDTGKYQVWDGKTYYFFNKRKKAVDKFIELHEYKPTRKELVAFSKEVIKIFDTHTDNDLNPKAKPSQGFESDADVWHISRMYLTDFQELLTYGTDEQTVLIPTLLLNSNIITITQMTGDNYMVYLKNTKFSGKFKIEKEIEYPNIKVEFRP